MLKARVLTAGIICTVMFACGTSGHHVTEKRAVPTFDAIEVSGAVQLEVEVGPDVSVTVEGDDGVLNRLQTDVREGKLWVHCEIPYVPDANLKVRVTTPNFNYLGVSTTGNINANLGGAPLDKLEVKVAGMGKLDLEGVDAKELDVRVRGAGNVTIGGQTDILKYEMSGAGAGKMEQLCARNATVTLKGAGMATVNTSDKLDATLSGVGSIRYYGDPEVTRHISKIGSLKHLGTSSEEAAKCPITDSRQVPPSTDAGADPAE